jgi:hypothetical protein
MVTQKLRAAGSGRMALCAAFITAMSLAAACDKMPLLAPTGTIITLIPTSNVVPVGGEVDIIATVIEQGVASTPTTTPDTTTTTTTATTRAGAGTPVQNGTLVSFTTTLGRIEPSEARTQNGQVRVKFISNGQSGTARVTAYSGGASGTLENLLIGTAAASRLLVSANPQSLGSSGGTAEVTALVQDVGGTGLRGVPVTFTTTAGSVSPSTAITDDSGVARTTISTNREAVVTAQAGDKTGTATIRVSAPIGLTLAVPETANVGAPARVTVNVSATANVQDVVIDWGDGQQTRLGAIGGSVTVPHTYPEPGFYTVTATATDAGGGRQTVSNTISVGALAVSLSASNPTPLVGTPVTFTATVPVGTQVLRYTWVFDDGVTQTTTDNSLQRVFTSRGQKVVRVDVTTVSGATGTDTTIINVQ